MPPRKPTTAAIVAFAALLLAGCERNEYEVVITPLENGFRRVLTCWRWDPDKQGKPLVAFPGPELDSIAAEYGQPPPQPAAQKFTFQAEFDTRTPRDLTGAGQLLRWTSPMGSCALYAERVRGRDDVGPQLEAKLAAADRLLDLADGWLASQLARQPGWDRLHSLLAGQARADLRNLVHYLWIGGTASQAGLTGPNPACTPVTDFAVRALFYLTERGYLVAADIPRVAALLEDDAANTNPALVLDWLLEVLARRTGLPADGDLLTALHQALDSPHALQSWSDYLETTDEWARRRADWQARGPESGAQEPKPLEVAESLVQRLFTPGTGGGDHLALRLATGVQPYATNAAWQAEAKAAVWQLPLPADDELPAFLFASWAVPDQAFQTAHFGRLVLREAELARYNLWYASLPPEWKTPWDTFLAGLTPQTDPAAAIRGFAFGQAGGQQQPALSPTVGVGPRLLVEALAQPAAADPAPPTPN